MEQHPRITRIDDHETSAGVRAQFNALVVAQFLRAFESLRELPKGPELAARRVWAEHPPERTASPPTQPGD